MQACRVKKLLDRTEEGGGESVFVRLAAAARRENAEGDLPILSCRCC